MISEFISTYGMTLVYSVFTAIAGAVGMYISKWYKKVSENKITKETAETCVKAVEQIYKDLSGEEKYQKAVEGIGEVLAGKGITISEFEIKMLIESACKELARSADMK